MSFECLAAFLWILTSKWIIFGVIFLTLLYWIGTYNHDYFKKLGVAYEQPLPFFGNSAPFLFRREHLKETILRIYHKNPERNFFGFFDFMKPVFVMKDAELIKQIGIKDFEHFLDHRGVFDEEADSIFAKSLFSIKGQKWKNMRHALSPAFTGSKMRIMFDLMNTYLEDVTETLLQKSKQNEDEYDMKILSSRMGTDIVATCAFGIENNSVKHPKNDFFIEGNTLTNLTGIQALKFLGYCSFPKIMKLLNIHFLKRSTVKFFKNIITSTVKYREEKNIVRPDMINLMMQARKKELQFETENDQKFEKIGFATVEDYTYASNEVKVPQWTDDDITAQCTIFFFGGFEPTSSMVSFMAYELAVNPEIQDQLRTEIDQVKTTLKDEEKKLSYEVLQKMKYLDMVASEALRKWTPPIFFDRICTKAYEMEDFDGRKVKVSVGDGIWMAANAIHMDPKNYPEPEKFYPERFSPENKGNIDMGSYIPFGIGPRNCIGSRFALLEAKAIFFHLLIKFHIEPCTRTQIPMQIKISSLNLQADKGCWLRLRARS